MPRTILWGTPVPRGSAEAILEGVGPFSVSFPWLYLDYRSREKHFKAPTKFSVPGQKVFKLQSLNRLLTQYLREIGGDSLIKQHQGAIHCSALKIMLRTSLVHLYAHQLEGKDLKIREQSHIWGWGQMTFSSFEEVAKGKHPWLFWRRGKKKTRSQKEIDFLD